MKALVFGTLFTALIVADSVKAQVLAGEEFRVNDATSGYLDFPSLAADPSGAFVIVWADNGAPGAVRGRKFAPSGVTIGLEFRINQRPVAGTQRPDVAVDATGRALAVWSNPSGLGVIPGVFGRAFDAAGRPLGPQFTISSAAAYEPSVAATPSGFVVVWSTDYFKDLGGVSGRAIDVAGNPLGPQFEVSTDTTGYQYAASVAAADAGAFVVAWASYLTKAPEVRARRFGPGGAPLGREFTVSTTPSFAVEPSVAMAADARFMVAWTGYDAIRGRRFNAAGAPMGTEFAVNSAPAPYAYAASVVSDKSGNFTVLWDAGAADERDVFGRRFTAAGAPRGAEFPVNTSTIGRQRRPDVASDAAGNVFAAWVSEHQSANFEVYGQRVGGLVPAAMTVEDGGNEIVEVADDFTLVTSWRNVNGAAQTFQGRASGFAVPAGLELTLSSPDATYGTVADGTTGDCAGQCITGTLAGARPPGHLDVGIVESIQPEAQGQAKRWRVHVGETFADVPRTSKFYREVETLVHHSITGGCAASTYCPLNSATREQMAVFVLVGKEGAGYLPPPCTTAVYADVPASSSFCPWVEEAARRGAAAGCGGTNFCPDVPITREQMAVLVLRTLDPLLDPPACKAPMFDDVPASSPYCRWIEELARRDVVPPCGQSSYCPSAPVTREQMARYITGTFGLSLYGPRLGHVPWMPSGSAERRPAGNRR